MIWRLQDGVAQKQEFDWLRDRPYGLPLIVLLPRPESILATLPLLPLVRTLQPRAVLPDGALGTPERAKQLLVAAPRNFADGSPRTSRAPRNRAHAASTTRRRRGGCR